jgi:amino acid permease
MLIDYYAFRYRWDGGRALIRSLAFREGGIPTIPWIHVFFNTFIAIFGCP